MYNVNYDYRDPDHPYMVYLPQPTGGAGMAPQTMPTMYQPMAAPSPSTGFINPPMPSGSQLLPMAGEMGPAGAAAEESYIENILRFNRGKIATIYMTFENNNQWNARVFRGRVETAGRDHIIISDPQTGKRYILLMVNLDWIEFDGPVAYITPTLPPGVQSELTTGTGLSSTRDEE